MRETFQEMTDRLKNGNAGALWQKAVLANRVAKVVRHRRPAYRQKCRILSNLLRMGRLRVTKATMSPYGVLLSVKLGRERLHVPLNRLDPDVQEAIRPAVQALLWNPPESAAKCGCRAHKGPPETESSGVSIPRSSMSAEADRL